MLHAEKVGIRQVVVVADAQRQNVAGGDIRGQLLDFVQRLIALRGDDAVPLETVRPQQAASSVGVAALGLISTFRSMRP